MDNITSPVDRLQEHAPSTKAAVVSVSLKYNQCLTNAITSLSNSTINSCITPICKCGAVPILVAEAELQKRVSEKFVKSRQKEPAFGCLSLIFEPFGLVFF